METLNFDQKETVKLRDLVLELYSLNNEINKYRFVDKVPPANMTIRALEISDALYSYVQLDDMDVYMNYK